MVEATQTPQHIQASRTALQAAYATGDKKQICFAMSDLGLAFFQANKYKEGLEMLDEAIALADELADYHVQARSLGFKVLAYQKANRLPDAFSIATTILELAERHNDPALKSDALANQAQIMLDSGDLVSASEHSVAARQAAEISGDQRRLMNVMGVSGHIALADASVEKALRYFEKALKLACEVGDQAAEYGYLGNKGLVLAWLGEHADAAEVFEMLLPHLRKRNEVSAEISTLHHLANAYSALEQDEKTLTITEQGIQLATIHENDAVFDFYKWRVLVYFKAQEIDEAQTLIETAIAHASQVGDAKRQVDFLLSLGESFMLSNMPEKALETYKNALKGAQAQNRTTDVAYLTGRVGIALAELNRIDEAITFHNEAISQARMQDLKQLEGEQLCLLAMAYQEKHDPEQAKTQCTAAITVFENANLKSDAEKARQLLANITATSAVR